jgi:myo-inositol-1(or 4)-monophosphatase
MLECAFIFQPLAHFSLLDVGALIRDRINPSIIVPVAVTEGRFMTAVDFAAFVEELADVAWRTLLPFFRTSLRAEDKSRGGMFDPVTEADRAAESAMRHLINRTFSHHGIIGEEFGSDRADAEYVWVLDPIDGTKSFICGCPTWGTLIGLLHHGVPIYGMMVQPYTREHFSAMVKWRAGAARAPTMRPPNANSRHGPVPRSKRQL